MKPIEVKPHSPEEAWKLYRDMCLSGKGLTPDQISQLEEAFYAGLMSFYTEMAIAKNLGDVSTAQSGENTSGDILMKFCDGIREWSDYHVASLAAKFSKNN